MDRSAVLAAATAYFAEREDAHALPLGILSAVAVLAFALALRWFRWQ